MHVWAWFQTICIIIIWQSQPPIFIFGSNHLLLQGFYLDKVTFSPKCYVLILPTFNEHCVIRINCKNTDGHVIN